MNVQKLCVYLNAGPAHCTIDNLIISFKRQIRIIFNYQFILKLLVNITLQQEIRIESQTLHRLITTNSSQSLGHQQTLLS